MYMLFYSRVVSLHHTYILRNCMPCVSEVHTCLFPFMHSMFSTHRVLYESNRIYFFICMCAWYAVCVVVCIDRKWGHFTCLCVSMWVQWYFDALFLIFHLTYTVTLYTYVEYTGMCTYVRMYTLRKCAFWCCKFTCTHCL